MKPLASRRHLLLGALTLPLLHLPATTVWASTTVTVGNATELDRALANANANTTIVLRNGTYQKSGNFEIRRNGSSSGPIRIVAQNHLGATIRGGGLLLEGTHVHVSGLRFDNARAIVNRDNCRVSNCAFSGSNGGVSVNGAANVVINNNEFRGWSGRCLAFNPLLNGSGRNPHIHHNHFRDSRDIAIALGFQEAHHLLRVNALVERNLFVNCTHDQVVNIKTSGNRLRRNTIVGGGAFVNRIGVDNTFEENWCEGGKGIWLSDRNCTATGNRLNNCDLLVLAGTITSDQVRGQNGGHPRAESARLINNVARRTTVGVVWGNYNLPAINTVVDRHNGRVDRGREQGTQIGQTNNSSAGSAAVRLQERDVGPVATNVSVPAEQPVASNPSPAPSGNTSSTPPQTQTQTPPTQTQPPPSNTDTAATPPPTDSPTLNTSSLSNFLQRSGSAGSGQLSLSREPIFAQFTAPTTTAPTAGTGGGAGGLGTTLGQSFNFPGSFLGNR